MKLSSQRWRSVPIICSAVVFCLATTVAAAPRAPSAAGHWEGAISVSGTELAG